MESFNTYLKQFPNYTPQVFDVLLPYLTRRSIGAGEYFLREGSVCRQIAFIEKGLIRLYYLNDGKEVTNCFCKENSITTSYRSLVTQKESDIAIQAIEDCELIVFSHDTLQLLYETGSFWQQVGRLAGEGELLAAESHNRFLRDMSATERYTQILEYDSDLLLRVPLNYLATYLQVAPETLSRIRKKVGRT